MNNILRGITVLLMLALASAAALTDDFDVDWYTVDGGGEMWTTGGDFELTGGFWPVATVQFCPGDLDGDGDTDHSDLGILLADWDCVGSGPEDCPGDLDGDFDTDHSDLGILLADWGCGT